MNKIKLSNNLIIAGVHKAGTTSLYTYLSWHPEICAANVKETHFFSDESYPKRFSSYSDYFIHCNSGTYLLEASPEYIYGGEKTAEKLKVGTNNTKIIVLLRDPVDKIYSSFKHRKKKLIFDSAYTFTQFKKDHLELNSLNEVDLKSDYSKELLDGSYIDYLPVWFEKFGEENIRIIFFDELKHDAKRILENICKWLQIDYTFFIDKDLTIENKSVSFKNEPLQKFSMQIADTFEPLLRRNYKVKKFLRDIYYYVNVKDKDEEIDKECINKIASLYSTKNLELKAFLKEKGYKKFPQWL